MAVSLHLADGAKNAGRTLLDFEEKCGNKLHNLHPRGSIKSDLTNNREHKDESYHTFIQNGPYRPDIHAQEITFINCYS